MKPCAPVSAILARARSHKPVTQARNGACPNRAPAPHPRRYLFSFQAGTRWPAPYGDCMPTTASRPAPNTPVAIHTLQRVELLSSRVPPALEPRVWAVVPVSVRRAFAADTGDPTAGLHPLVGGCVSVCVSVRVSVCIELIPTEGLVAMCTWRCAHAALHAYCFWLDGGLPNRAGVARRACTGTFAWCLLNQFVGACAGKRRGWRDQPHHGHIHACM